MSSSSPGMRGCTSGLQRPSLERNTSTATARTVGTCLARRYVCQQKPSLERNASTATAWVTSSHVTGMADAAPGMQQSLLHRTTVSSMHLNVQWVHVGEGDKRGWRYFWCHPIVLGDLLGDAGGHQHVQGHAGRVCAQCTQTGWKWWLEVVATANFDKVRVLV